MNGPTQSENVLEGLQPNSNLKKLRISCYRGSKFSTWMKDSLLPNLVEISLENCRRYEHLPPLGNLPYLKVLFLTGNHIVKYLGNEFYGDSAIVFPSLESLELCDMTNLEEWRTVNGKESFPHLRKLLMAGCSRLEEFPIIPSVTSFTIRRSNAKLLCSVKNLTSLSFLAIEYFDKLTLLPDVLLQNHKMLVSLRIYYLCELESLANQLNSLSAMKYLEISYCNKLQSLPEGIQKLRCLQSLHILCCYRFASFQMFGFGGLSSLRKLWIEKCEAFCFLSEGIQYLTALEELCLDKCPKQISLPDGIQHLTNLRTLQIWNCDRLSALPTQIGCLTSLSYLAIEYCSSLMSIPDEMQNLRTLKTLLIRECPHLKRRCKKGSGVDWHKIAHIPNFQTYF